MVVQKCQRRPSGESFRRALLVLAAEMHRLGRPTLAQELEVWVTSWDGAITGGDDLWDALHGLEVQVSLVLARQVSL